MKHLIAFLLALASTFAHAQATGDYLFQRKSASAFSAVWITPSGTNLIGFNGSGGLTSVAQSTFLTPAQGNAAYSLLGHTHTASQVTDFNTAGDARWALIAHTHTFASLTSKPTTIAGYGITDFNSLGDARWSLLGHVHAAGDITSGTMATARLGSGTANGTTFLRGDQTWAVPTFTITPTLNLNATGSTDAFYGTAVNGEAFHGVSTNSHAFFGISTGTVGTAYFNNQSTGLALDVVQNGGTSVNVAAFTGNDGSVTIGADGGSTWTGTGAATTRTSLGLGTLATQSGTFSGTSSGTNTGDNAVNSLYSGLVSNATHTGDVTGATALTIANDAVTNAKAANMAQATVKGRAAAAGTGDPTDLTPNEVSTILDGATDPFVRTSAATSGITQLTGDVTAGPGSGSQAATLASVITAGGPTGSASVVPVITYDAKGRLTAVTTATITPAAIGAPSGSGTSTGTNTGDQTTIVGITGTKAQFDAAVSDGNILYVGDVTQYTDELAQDAVGTMVDGTITYTDGTPLLSRAALTGAITAPSGSNATSLGSFTVAQLSTAISDANISGTNTGDQTSIVGITGSLAEFNTALTGADFATGGGTVTGASSGTNTGDQTTIVGITGTIAQFNTAITDGDLATGGGTATGTNTGDQTITLTGNVTGSGTGSFAATIAADAVTLAQQADVATGTVFYRKTALTGNPEVQTLATLKTDLGLTGTNSGDQTSIVGITGSLAEFNAALTGADFATGGGTATGANTLDVTLAGTPDYITISGQVITRGLVDLTTDVDDRLPFVNIADVAASRLMGRGSAGGAGAMEEIGLGTGLSMSGTTLNGLPDQTITNSSDATSHTVTLSASGGTVQLIEGSNITLTTGGTASAGTVTIASTGGGGVSDGDKGDITVTASGATWTIDAGVVTYASMQNTASASVLLGRGDSGTGSPQEITIGSGLTMTGTTISATGGGGFDANKSMAYTAAY